MEQLEAWLKARGINVVGQAATGSGEMVRIQLRLLDGFEFGVAFSAVTLLERPQEAISEVERLVIEHEESSQLAKGN